jgi:ATP-dependent Clp protease adaptor protein ClpS
MRLTVPMYLALMAACDLVLSAAILWFGLTSEHHTRLDRLVDEGVPTEGTVTAFDDRNPYVAQFKFDAEGVTYASDKPRKLPAPVPGGMRVGSRLTVWYVPADPSICSARAPATESSGEFGGLCLIAIAVPPVAIGILLVLCRHLLTTRYDLIIHNDDTHTYEYVIALLHDVFGIPPDAAYRMAKTIDRRGARVVFKGTREEVKRKRDEVTAYGPDPRVPTSTGPLLVEIRASWSG